MQTADHSLQFSKKKNSKKDYLRQILTEVFFKNYGKCVKAKINNK